MKTEKLKKIVKNTSSMKQNNWTTRCTQNEAESARETLSWLESVTELEPLRGTYRGPVGHEIA